MINKFKALDNIGLISYLRKLVLAIRQFFATKSEMDVVATALTDLDTRKVDVSNLVDYEVTVTELGELDNILKSYVIAQGGLIIGTISIPKDLIVSSGSVVVGDWINGVFTENTSGTGKAIKLVISNQSEPIYINVQDLANVYTAQQGATEILLAISNTNEISATLVKSVRDKIDNAITISNYNSYSPTLTGTGASGTWGINITGSANSAGNATKLQTARTIWGQSFDGTNNVNGVLQVIDITRKGDIATQIKESALVEISTIGIDNDALYIGQLSNSTIWLQSAYGGSSSVSSAKYTYPIVLNPLGGNVGIGTTTPSSKLHVVGDIYTTTGFKKENSSDSYVLLGGGGHKKESLLSVNYAASAGNANTATSVDWSGVTNKPVIGNGRLILKNGNDIISDNFTANIGNDITIDLNSKFTNKNDFELLGSRVDKIDTSIAGLNTAIQVENPIDDSDEGDEETIETNNEPFTKQIGIIRLRFWNITTYTDLPVYDVWVNHVADVIEPFGSVSYCYDIFLVTGITNLDVSSVGLTSDSYKPFFIRGANSNNKVCEKLDVRGNGNINTARATIIGGYMHLQCRLKLHGGDSGTGNYIMEKVKNENFSALLCLRQTP